MEKDRKTMIHEELTAKILEACFEVSNELGVGYIESVYENRFDQRLDMKEAIRDLLGE